MVTWQGREQFHCSFQVRIHQVHQVWFWESHTEKASKERRVNIREEKGPAFKKGAHLDGGTQRLRLGLCPEII